MDRRWVIQPDFESETQELQKALKIHPVLCRLLVQRGIKTFEGARRFFRPTLDDLHDPFLMKDMTEAVLRINKAILNKEKILIYGDYDVDGTTSIALAYSFFKKLTDRIDFYVPDRYSEGYGVSMKAMKWAKENDFNLIISIDCGIKAIPEITFAKENQIDFIVCDHHFPGDVLPPAVAILDPKQSDCTYPYVELSGCGIAFKLIQAYAKQYQIDKKEVYRFLDLVSVSIASDIVPITGENRILSYHGLNKLNTNPSKGLQTLMDTAGLQKPLTITDVVFGIGPRINAAGRMIDARHAVELLISQTNSNAKPNAERLQKHNEQRKKLDKAMTQEALKMIGDDTDYHKKKSTILYKSDWNKGVIGIVASRVMEVYYRPTIIMTESNGMITGSARSVKNFNIYNAINECKDLLEGFGGHKYAAGLTISKENFPEFKEKFDAIVQQTIKDEWLIPEINIDAELDFSQIHKNFFKILRQFAPFGPANMNPVFLSKGVQTRSKRTVGDGHLKISLKQNGSKTINGIGFGLADKHNSIQSENLQICYHIVENNWKNLVALELELKDVKPIESN